MIIAMVALYALALQAVLGTALPYGASGPFGVICASHAGASDQDPTKAPPVHNHLSCCTAAQAAPSAIVPSLASTAIVWPVRRAGRVVWRPEVMAAPRAPPNVQAFARAPPVA